MKKIKYLLILLALPFLTAAVVSTVGKLYSVLSGGKLRIESAYISSAGTVTQETSDWINGSCSPNGGASSSCQINSGIFSSAHCHCDSKSGGYWNCFATNFSGTTLLYSTGNASLNGAADVTMTCIGIQ